MEQQPQPKRLRLLTWIIASIAIIVAMFFIGTITEASCSNQPGTSAIPRSTPTPYVYKAPKPTATSSVAPASFALPLLKIGMEARFPGLKLQCADRGLNGACLGYKETTRRIGNRYADIITLLIYDGQGDNLVSIAFEELTDTTGEITICESTTANENKYCNSWIHDTFAFAGLVLSMTADWPELHLALED